MSKQKLPKLPLSKKFPLRAEAAIYPPQGGRATILKGGGYWTLSFEPTKKPNIAAVKLKDIALTILPFSFVFDIDRDGRMEHIEVGKFVVGLKDFDREITKGTLNLKTGELSMAFGISLTPKTIPLLEELGVGPLRLSLTERGIMNLATGMFKTHAGVFKVPKGPLAGMTIRAGQWPPTGRSSYETPPTPPPESSIDLWVNCVAPPADSAAIAQNPPRNKEITICPEDPILLSWRSSADVPNVELEPDITGLQPSSDNHPIIPGPTTETLYRATTVGGYSHEEDTVIVHIFDPSVPIQFTATAYHGSRKWSIEVSPESWSGNIRVREVRIKRPTESGYEDCFDWPKFNVEHWSTGETVPDGFEANSAWRVVTGLFPLAGRWDFWPVDGVPDWDEIKLKGPPLCFAIRGECVRM